MRLIAKAALGAFALASLGFSASAQVIVRHPVIVHPGIVTTNPCLGPVSLRPGFCFRGGRMALLTRPSWRNRMLLRRHFRRQAMLARRFGY